MQALHGKCSPAAGLLPRPAAHRRPLVLLPASAAAAPAAVSLTTRTTQVRRKDQKKLQELEARVLELVSSAKGRSQLSPDQVEELDAAVAALEASGGVPDPTADPELDGRWRLLFTSSPRATKGSGSVAVASPVQRTFTAVDSFAIFQEVSLQGPGEARVNNVVQFGPRIGYLNVQAQASTDSRPLEGFTPRSGEEFLFGLFGRSKLYPPARPNLRIDFQFDKAAFYFALLPFSIPYPVPFKLLGDERKGFIDVTYMSRGSTALRLSRGNKGTLFILQKDASLKEQLLDAVRRQQDDEVLALIDKLAESNPTPNPARSPKVAGTWRLVWSQQSQTAGALQKFGSKQAKSYQVINTDGTLRNIVELGPWLRLSVQADCEASSSTRTGVAIGTAGLVVGEGKLEKPWFLPVPGARRKDGQATQGWVDWLYLDDQVRVTRGNKGSLFVHTREA